MRRLLIPLVAAAVGCQAYPLDRRTDAGLPAPPGQLLPSRDREGAGPAPPLPHGRGSDVVVRVGGAGPPPLVPPKGVEERVDGGSPPAPPVGRPPLALADPEQLALASNPTLPQAAALVQQQQGLTRQAGLYPNPVAG